MDRIRKNKILIVLSFLSGLSVSLDFSGSRKRDNFGGWIRSLPGDAGPWLLAGRSMKEKDISIATQHRAAFSLAIQADTGLTLCAILTRGARLAHLDNIAFRRE